MPQDVLAAVVGSPSVAAALIANETYTTINKPVGPAFMSSAPDGCMSPPLTANQSPLVTSTVGLNLHKQAPTLQVGCGIAVVLKMR